jgi:hypothetical protein
VQGPDGCEASEPALDSRGRARPLNRRWEIFHRSNLRFVEAPDGRASAHVPFTSQQFEALARLLLYLKRNHQGSFRIENILAQDEITPGALAGPGPSLGAAQARDPDNEGKLGAALGMPLFRAMLRDRRADELMS